MRIFAISDPHLSCATPGKSMDVFGDEWAGHPEVMAERWRAQVGAEDIVLVAGDISWAMRHEGARPDLELIASLPGRKVLIRGNHDYWWSSPSKLRALLPEGVSIVHHDAVTIEGVSIAGTRLWDDAELRFGRVPLRPRTCKSTITMAAPKPPEENEKILRRELGRLERSLATLDPAASIKIAMVHYPPVGYDLGDSRAAAIIEQSEVSHCVFGHLHGLIPRKDNPLFGRRGGVEYVLTSCDYLEFTPLEIARVGDPRDDV